MAVLLAVVVVVSDDDADTIDVASRDQQTTSTTAPNAVAEETTTTAAAPATTAATAAPTHRGAAPRRAPAATTTTAPAFRRHGIACGAPNEETMRGARGDVAVMDADGSNRRQFPAAEGTKGMQSITWSPDGTTLVYTTSDKYGGGILRMRPDGTDRQVIYAPPSMYERIAEDVQFSPRGDRLATHIVTGSNRGLVLLNPDGSGMRTIISDTESRSASSPDWLNEETLVMVNDRGGTQDDPKGTLWTVNVDGTGFRELPAFGEAREPAVSPDRSSIAFVSRRSGRDAIWVGDVDGSNLRQLTVPIDEHGDLQPAWSPDGTKVIFDRTESTPDGEVRSLYVVDVAGGRPDLVASRCYNATWR